MKRLILFAALFASTLVAQIIPQIATPTGQLAGVGQMVIIPLEGSGYATVGIQITGTWSATQVFEGTVDCVNWFNVFVALMPGFGSNPPVVSSTANNAWSAAVSGLCAFRVRTSVYASGTANVVLRPGVGTYANALGIDQSGRPLVDVGQATTAGDASGNTGLGLFPANGGGTPLYTYPYGFNGSLWDRFRTASAANLSAATSKGASLVEKGPRWAVSSVPAVSNQASASQASGGAGVRHVADCVSFSGGSTTAPALTQLVVNLRDGATGAGTVIWSHTVIVTAAVGQNVAPFSACGLGLVGTAATAMTLEFSALLTNLFENASLSGYDAP